MRKQLPSTFVTGDCLPCHFQNMFLLLGRRHALRAGRNQVNAWPWGERSRRQVQIPLGHALALSSRIGLENSEALQVQKPAKQHLCRLGGTCRFGSKDPFLVGLASVQKPPKSGSASCNTNRFQNSASAGADSAIQKYHQSNCQTVVFARQKTAAPTETQLTDAHSSPCKYS